jgi:hypothetical protein
MPTEHQQHRRLAELMAPFGEAAYRREMQRIKRAREVRVIYNPLADKAMAEHVLRKIR